MRQVGSWIGGLALPFVMHTAAIGAEAPAAGCSKAAVLALGDDADWHDCLARQARDGALAALSDAELFKLSAALSARLSVDGASLDADSVMVLSREYGRRHTSAVSAASQQYGVLVMANRFDEAEALAQREGLPAASFRPTRVPLAEPRPDGQTTFWRLDGARQQLVQGAVDLSRGRHIVVYAATGCSFTMAALRDIAADPELRAAFDAHGRWVTVPDGSFGPALFADWAAATHFPLDVLLDRKPWPRRSIQAVPYFFVMDAGRAVGTVLGWNPPDSGEKLKALLAR